MSDGGDGSELRERFLRGDPDALGGILVRWGACTRARLRRKFAGLLNDEDIEDVLAVALYRLWRSRSSYDPGRLPLGRWFETIAVNVARDVLKSGWQRARQREVSHEGDIPDSPQGNEEGTSESASAPFLRQQRVRALIQQLSETQRRIVEADIACWPGVAPSAELAAELGIAESSVPVYRRRARAWLRDRLGSEGFGNGGC